MTSPPRKGAADEFRRAAPCPPPLVALWARIDRAPPALGTGRDRAARAVADLAARRGGLRPRRPRRMAAGGARLSRDAAGDGAGVSRMCPPRRRIAEATGSSG